MENKELDMDTHKRDMVMVGMIIAFMTLLVVVGFALSGINEESNYCLEAGGIPVAVSRGTRYVCFEKSAIVEHTKGIRHAPR